MTNSNDKLLTLYQLPLLRTKWVFQFIYFEMTQTLTLFQILLQSTLISIKEAIDQSTWHKCHQYGCTDQSKRNFRILLVCYKSTQFHTCPFWLIRNWFRTIHWLQHLSSKLISNELIFKQIFKMPLILN